MNIENHHKRVVASNFSGSRQFWKTIYDPRQETIDTCYSVDMIKRKKAVFSMLEKYANGSSLFILDVGCGPGVFMEDALRQGHHVIGMDLSEAMVVEARNLTVQNYRNKSAALRGDSEFLPFKSCSFDAVLCIGVLSYLDRDAPSLREIGRVLKKNGLVILGLPNWLRLPLFLDPYYYLNRFVVVVAKKFSRKRKDGPRPAKLEGYRRYLRWRLRALFTKSGLSMLRSSSIGFGPITFWKREIVASRYSISLSEKLESISNRRLFFFLTAFANHWVICLKKANS